MKTITFKNGKTINYDFFERTQSFYMGASREGVRCTLSAGEIPLAELNELLNDENATAELVVTGADGQQEIKTGYVIKKEIAVKNEVVQEETPQTPAVYADVMYFELCQRTYLENLLINLGIN